MAEDCPTYRLRDPNDNDGCGCNNTTNVIMGDVSSTTYYGRVVSGSGQSYVVNLYEQGPLLPSTIQVTVSCPDLDPSYTLASNYPILVMMLENGTYLSLPTLVFNNPSLPFVVE